LPESFFAEAASFEPADFWAEDGTVESGRVSRSGRWSWGSPAGGVVFLGWAAGAVCASGAAVAAPWTVRATVTLAATAAAVAVPRRLLPGIGLLPPGPGCGVAVATPWRCGEVAWWE